MNVNPNRKPDKPRSPEAEAEITKLLSELLEPRPAAQIASQNPGVLKFVTKAWNRDRLKAAREAQTLDQQGIERQNEDRKPDPGLDL